MFYYPPIIPQDSLHPPPSNTPTTNTSRAPLPSPLSPHESAAVHTSKRRSTSSTSKNGTSTAEPSSPRVPTEKPANPVKPVDPASAISSSATLVNFREKSVRSRPRTECSPESPPTSFRTVYTRTGVRACCCPPSRSVERYHAGPCPYPSGQGDDDALPGPHTTDPGGIRNGGGERATRVVGGCERQVDSDGVGDDVRCGNGMNDEMHEIDVSTCWDFEPLV